MSRLAIAIKLVASGASEPIYYGDCISWKKRVCDVRDLLKYVTGGDEDNKSVGFFSFCENGCLLTIVKAVVGRLNDHVEAWIFIPNNTIISGEELLQVAGKVKKAISSSRINESIIKEIVSKEYNDKKHVFVFKPSNPDGIIGYRRVGCNPLTEILDKRYQPYYTNYKYILLLDDFNITEVNDTVIIHDDVILSSTKQSSVDNIVDMLSPSSLQNDRIKVDILEEYKKTIVDLTSKPLIKICYLIPPESDNVGKVFGDEARICRMSDDGRRFAEFNKVIPVEEKETIKLCAYRKDFEPIPFEISVTEEEQICIIPKEIDNVWKKKITYSMFCVKGSDDKSLSEYKPTIKINNKQLTMREPLYLRENDSERCQISVSLKKSSNYEEYSKEKSLIRINEQDKMCIVLNRKINHVEFDVEINEGQDALLTIESRSDIDRYQSPLLGYKSNGSRLYKDQLFVLKQRALGSLYGIGVIFIIFLLSLIYKNIGFKGDFPFVTWGEKTDNVNIEANSDKNETPNDTYAPSEAYFFTMNDSLVIYQEKTAKMDNSKAIEYLNKNTIWKKDSLERYNCLKGLWDAMNTYDFKKIRNYKIFGESVVLCLDSIILISDSCQNNNLKYDETYNDNPNDFDITISKYIEKLKSLLLSI